MLHTVNKSRANFMRMVLFLTGKTKEKYITEGIQDYERRIKKYTSFEIVTLPGLKNSGNLTPAEVRSKEGGKIISSLDGDDYVILLDEKGTEFATADMSKWLEKLISHTKKRLVFIIGGSWGFSDEVYQRADFILSLSKLTFSHQLARLVFMEQIYRVLAILKGDPYHHA